MGSGTVMLVRTREPVPRETRLLALGAVVASFVFIPALALKMSQSVPSSARVHAAPPPVRHRVAAAAKPASAPAKPAPPRPAPARPAPASFSFYPTPPALQAAFTYLAARAGGASFARRHSGGQL